MSAPGRRRRTTSTSNFGVGRREGHDASAFYQRFPPPDISSDSGVALASRRDVIWQGDARDMDACGEIADNSVALVVTSPPYFAGKEYEETVGQGLVPASYIEYLDMLEGVFSECARKLEPGGRIAVNVANLGRRPYRSLSADVISILQDRLRLLLRGEVIWRKAKGAAGNCAWGSFRQPSNPVLRDLTERVVIASKGRFDRAIPAAMRAREGLPSAATSNADEFMEATIDVWDIPSESAVRVGHPAPFPVELPERLIQLYTYRNDLVLDPFMGSGTTAVAAVRSERHYIGFDTDASYIALAEHRIATERKQRDQRQQELSALKPHTKPSKPHMKQSDEKQQELPAKSDDPIGGHLDDLAGNNPGVLSLDGDNHGDAPVSQSTSTPETAEVLYQAEEDGNSQEGDCVSNDFQARAVQEGQRAQSMAESLLRECGFRQIRAKVDKPGGVQVNFEALDKRDGRWLFDVSGAFSVTQRPGLRRTDTLWKALGKAAVLHSTTHHIPLILLTTDRPLPNSAGQRALDVMTGPGKPVRAVLVMLSPEDHERLASFAEGDSQL